MGVGIPDNHLRDSQVLSTDEGDSHIPRPEVTSGLLMVVEIKLQLSFFVVITTRASRPQALERLEALREADAGLTALALGGKRAAEADVEEVGYSGLRAALR